MIKDLRPVRGARYIASLIAQGEHEQQDFKFAISDARKIARSLSAFANRSGGRLLIGVKDNGVVAGVRSEEDIFVVEQAAEMYCVPAQTLRFTAFRMEGGEIVLRAEIDSAPSRPVSVREQQGVLKAYLRVADENIAVPPLLEQIWRRTASGNISGGIGQEAQLILRVLGGCGKPLTVSGIAQHTGLSTRTVEECVITLGSMSLLRTEIAGGGLLISLPDMV